MCQKKSHITQHEVSLLHKNSIKQPLRQLQISDQQSSVSGNQIFFKDMCEAFIAANIPWKKLQNTKLKEFLQSYTGRHIPEESTLRKNYLQQVYNDVCTYCLDFIYLLVVIIIKLSITLHSL